jgi:hypothetical protein
MVQPRHSSPLHLLCDSTPFLHHSRPRLPRDRIFSPAPYRSYVAPLPILAVLLAPVLNPDILSYTVQRLRSTLFQFHNLTHPTDSCLNLLSFARGLPLNHPSPTLDITLTPTITYPLRCHIVLPPLSSQNLPYSLPLRSAHTQGSCWQCSSLNIFITFHRLDGVVSLDSRPCLCDPNLMEWIADLSLSPILIFWAMYLF